MAITRSETAGPRGSALKTIGACESETEEVRSSMTKGRRKRRWAVNGGLSYVFCGFEGTYLLPRYADIDDAAEALEYEECLPEAYDRSARKHGRGAAVAAPTGEAAGAAEARRRGMEGALPDTALPRGMAHDDDGWDGEEEEEDDEDTAEAYDSEDESSAALGVDWTNVGAEAAVEDTSTGDHAVDTIIAPLAAAAAAASPPLFSATLVGPVAVAATVPPASSLSFSPESVHVPSVAASASTVPEDPAAAALAARMRGHLDTLHATVQQTERLALQAESVSQQLGAAKQRQSAAAAAEVQARQAAVATQAASAIAVAAAAAAGDLERAGRAAHDRAVRVAAAAALAAKAAAEEAAAAKLEASVFLEKAIVARREAERASAANVNAVAAIATAWREKEEAAARVASLEAELIELAARCPG